MRQPIGIGQFYAGEADLLAEEIIACYDGQRGPGAPPLSVRNDRARAVIAPNSPYRNAGQCMAWAYKRIAETPPADVYVIIAPNRTGTENAVTLDAFGTPFQATRVDQELAKALVQKGSVVMDDDAHNRETSVEVQLPFLQHALGSDAERIKILPLLIGESADARAIAIDLKEALTECGRDPVFVVSSDLTRYGPLFKFLPFVTDIPERIRALDDALLARIREQDPDGFAALVEEQMNPVDGARCVELLLHLLRPCEVEVEQVYASGDVLQDWKNSVTYAAVTFRERPFLGETAGFPEEGF